MFNFLTKHKVNLRRICDIATVGSQASSTRNQRVVKLVARGAVGALVLHERLSPHTVQKPAVSPNVPRELPHVVGGANNQGGAGVHDRGVAASGGGGAARCHSVVQVQLPEAVPGIRNGEPLEGLAAVVARVRAAQSEHAAARVVEIERKDARVDEAVLHELVEGRGLRRPVQKEWGIENADILSFSFSQSRMERKFT